jgi:hypothetical protein
VSALTNTPTSKATQDRQERLAQLATALLALLRKDEVRQLSRHQWQSPLKDAAIALGLLGEGDARRALTDCTCSRGGNAATCECREGEARP